MMIDQNKIEIAISRVEQTPSSWSIRTPSQRLLTLNETFTRSNGTVVSRIYERLTKASRRAEGNDGWEEYTRIAQVNYRRGVYDAFKALQEELRFSD